TVSSDTVTVRGALHVTFVARDSADVPRTSGGDTVRFEVLREPTGGEASVGDVTDHDDGTYSASITATRDGVVRIGASINGRSKHNGIPTVTVLSIPVTPQKSTVSVSADTIDAGQSATFTVLLRDLDGEPVSGSADRIAFTLGGEGSSDGLFGPTTEAGEGRYTAVFTAQRAGSSVTVGAIFDDSTRIQMLDSLGNSHLPTITVRPGPATADSSLLVAEPVTINVGDSATIRLVTRDNYGNLVETGGRRVAFSRDGGAGVSVGRIGAVSDRQDGTYTAFYYAASSGTADAIHATLDGRAVMSGDVTITVGPACTPGPISLKASEVTINDTTPARRPVKRLTIQSGVTTTLTLRIADADGCAISEPRNVAFLLSGGTSTGVIGVVANLDDGRYTATFTGHVAGSGVNVSATVDGQPVTSPPVNVAVVPGDISTRTSQFTAAAPRAAVGTPVLLTLRARDVAGNVITRGGRGVTFFVLGTQVHGSVGSTTDHGDGTYSATYVGGSVGTDGVVALIEGTKVAQTVTIVVDPPPP
ncbi:MAG: invasin domain 3-containing protein, partial [Gemmatimonadota bacterium]